MGPDWSLPYQCGRCRFWAKRVPLGRKDAARHISPLTEQPEWSNSALPDGEDETAKGERREAEAGTQTWNCRHKLGKEIAVTKPGPLLQRLPTRRSCTVKMDSAPIIARDEDQCSHPTLDYAHEHPMIHLRQRNGHQSGG